VPDVFDQPGSRVNEAREALVVVLVWMRETCEEKFRGREPVEKCGERAFSIRLFAAVYDANASIR